MMTTFLVGVSLGLGCIHFTSRMFQARNYSAPTFLIEVTRTTIFWLAALSFALEGVTFR